MWTRPADPGSKEAQADAGSDYPRAARMHSVHGTETWSQQHPQSALAQLLYARALYARAIALRGEAYARDTPEASMQLFRHYLEMAEAQLASHAQVLREESTADVYLAMFGRWHLPFKQLHEIALDSTRKNPADLGAWDELATASLPRWGGSTARFEEVAREAGRHVTGLDANTVYALEYDANSLAFEGPMFTSSRVDWPTMRQGLQSFLAKHPNPWLLNRLAYQACMAEDKPTTQQALDQIGAHPWQDAWAGRYETCRRWARAT